MQEAESEGFDLDINKSKKMPQVDRTGKYLFFGQYTFVLLLLLIVIGSSRLCRYCYRQ